MNTESEPRFDVIAVNIKTSTKRVIVNNVKEKDAEAIVSMAVMRRGVEEEFFKVIPVGTVKEPS